MFGNKSRRRTRSPIKERPLRAPGESVQAEVDRFLIENMVAWWMFPIFCLIIVVLEWLRWLFKWPPQPVPITVAAVGASAICLWQFFRGREYLRQLRLGKEGELSVAQMLDELRAHGFHVFNDIVGDGYNIDHVVVGPTGVYAIETKTRSIPTDHQGKVVYDGERVLVNGFAPDRDPIKQAQALADSVAKMLAPTTGQRPFVQPVVVFPGWQVEAEGANRSARVWVLNAKRLLGWIKNERASLPPEQVAGYAAVLKTHARSRA